MGHTLNIHGSPVTVKSIFPGGNKCWGTLVEREWQAFRHITGPEFNTPMKGKTCGPINILVFPTMEDYHQYMSAFVGFAANAGGLFVKKYKTLFTYQRTSQISFISVEELILHEFGHFLQGCYVLPGTFGTPAYNAQPKGFQDEGLAEFWATLNFNKKGCHSLPLRENYMKRVCRNDQYPKWKLADLLSERQGYDQGGVFHYMMAYTFQYFMATKHRSTLRKVLKQLRANTYKLENWAEITGKPVAEWNRLWHESIREYCSKTKIQKYPWTCPAPKSQLHSSCSTIGHGYSKRLWHTTMNSTQEDLGESSDLQEGSQEEDPPGTQEDEDDEDEEENSSPQEEPQDPLMDGRDVIADVSTEPAVVNLGPMLGPQRN